MMEPADDGTAGFTLVEMLVALSIVGLLSATVLGFAGQLGRIASLEPRLVERREAEMAADFLARTVGDALPLGIDRRADAVVPFEGEDDAVRFVGPIRTGVRATGLRTIQFDLDGTDLRLHALPRRPLGPKPDIELWAERAAGQRMKAKVGPVEVEADRAQSGRAHARADRSDEAHGIVLPLERHDHFGASVEAERQGVTKCPR